MISQTAEYALRAVAYLAKHPDEPLTTQQIAAATELPAGYLAKVMQSLSRSRLVSSRPGRNGGFVLLKAPAELSALDVINAVDPFQRVHECPLRLDTHQEHLCVLHAGINQAIDAIEALFGEMTIAELLKKPRRTSNRCPFPSP